MLNRDFLRRLVFRLSHGHGGWLPWYNFYTGGLNPDTEAQNASQLVMTDVRPDLALGHGKPDVFASAFGAHGGADAQSLHDSVRDAADHVRFTRSSGSASEITGGVKQALALQNFYMGYAQTGSDPEGLQIKLRTPLVAVPLDPDVLVDPVDGPFSNDAVVSAYIDPDLVSGTGVELTDVFMETLRARLTHGDLAGSLVWSGGRRTQNFNLNPYVDTLDSRYEANEFAIPFMTSTDLDFDPARPPLRFVGFSFGDMLSYTPAAVTADVLKLSLSADPMHTARLNPNCVMLALHTCRAWYTPVAGVLQGGVSPVTKISELYEAAWNRPSFNVIGFSTSTAPIAITSSARPRIKYRTVVTIDRPGTTARGLYRIERYAGNVIEHTLTNHLPATDATGNKARYFTEKATFLHDTDNNPDAYTHDAFGCLQPVAFPAGQLPDDPWIWFVSMDDDYKFWLNKQEIGMANTADCVSEIGAPPLQVVVTAASVYLLYGSEIRVLNKTSAAWSAYRCRVELPDTMLRAIAVDRETNRVWVGHRSGVFELLASGVSEIDVSSIPTEARSVSKQGLVATNGYLAWSTSSVFTPRGDYDRFLMGYIVRVTVATAKIFAWSQDAICDAGTDSVYQANSCKQLGRVGLRSNGEVLVAHTDPGSSAGYAQVTLSWFRVNNDGTLFRRHWCSKFGLLGPSIYQPNIDQATEHMVYMPPIHRIDDFHFVTGQVPFRYPAQNAREKDTFSFDMGGWSPTLSPEGPSQTIDFRLDEEMNWVHLHPRAYSSDNDRFVKMGAVQFSDAVNFPSSRNSLVPPFSLVTRGSEFEFALLSFCPVRIAGCYALLMAGNQQLLPMGLELDWTGTDWTHRVAGQPARAKALHADAQACGPHFKIAFDASGTNHVFNKTTCYRVDVQPGTSLTVPDASLYLGEYDTVTETVVPDATGVAVVSKAALGMFCGIDTENTKDIGAWVGTAALARVPSSPTTGQFSVTTDGKFVFAVGLAGVSVKVKYNYIMQAG